MNNIQLGKNKMEIRKKKKGKGVELLEKKVLLFFFQGKVKDASLITIKWERFLYSQNPSMNIHEPRLPVKLFLLLNHKRR